MPDIIHIHDADDQRVAAYVSIRERDLTRGHGARFIVEGKVTLETLLTRSHFKPESLFLVQSRLAPLRSLIEKVPDGVPVYVAPQDIMDQVVGFAIHRGVLACAQKGTQHTATGLLSTLAPDTEQIMLCLMELSNHDNVGACFRNAAAFGVDAVLLDQASCDPLYRKAIRVSAGAALTLPFAHGGSGADIFAALEAQGFEIWCLTPRPDVAPINTLTRPKKLALMLGAEGSGLPDTLLARGKPVRIPMDEGFDSINVATAGAIAMSTVFSGT